MVQLFYEDFNGSFLTAVMRLYTPAYWYTAAGRADWSSDMHFSRGWIFPFRCSRLW